MFTGLFANSVTWHVIKARKKQILIRQSISFIQLVVLGESPAGVNRGHRKMSCYAHDFESVVFVIGNVLINNVLVNVSEGLATQSYFTTGGGGRKEKMKAIN